MTTQKQLRIHPNAPERLKSAYMQHGRNLRSLARDLDINPFYVHAALKYALKPSNKKLQYKLFFKVRSKPAPVPDWKKKLRKIPKEKRDRIFEALLSGTHCIVKKEKK